MEFFKYYLQPLGNQSDCDDVGINPSKSGKCAVIL